MNPAESSAEELERLMELAREITGIDDRDLLVRRALKEMCEREAARRLVLRGGTIPDMKAPPRRRFEP
jgi:hypothetical protein